MIDHDWPIFGFLRFNVTDLVLLYQDDSDHPDDRLDHRWNSEAMVEGVMKLCSMPGRREGGMPKGRGMRGAEANRNLSTSDSWSRFVLARRFWNQILTWNRISIIVSRTISYRP